MIDNDRLRSRMAEQAVSQGALARAIGVSQQSISKLASGSSYNSRQLHRIARELGTTPAWLTGETDDPLSDAPDEPELTHDERQLVDAFGHLSPADQSALLQIARTMAEKSGPTVHAPKLAYRAQAQRQGLAG